MEHVATYRYISDDADIEGTFYVKATAGDADTAAIQAADKLCFMLAQWCMSSSDGYQVPFDMTGIQPTDPELAVEQAVNEAEIAAYGWF